MILTASQYLITESQRFSSKTKSYKVKTLQGMNCHQEMTYIHCHAFLQDLPSKYTTNEKETFKVHCRYRHSFGSKLINVCFVFWWGQLYI